MAFLEYGNVIVPDTTATGGLKSTGDTYPQYATGTVTYKIASPVSAGVRKYVYALAGAALTDQKATWVVDTGGTDGATVKAVAVADSSLYGYVGAPAASITSGKYGWVQVAGPVTALDGLVSEARTAGGQIDHTSGKLAYLTAGALGSTIASVFGYVRVANTAAATTGNIHLIGKEILPHT